MATFLRYYLPVLLWGAFIVFLSTSGFHGGATLDWIRSLVRAVFPDVSSATLQTLNAIVRKLAHVTEYFILGLLLWRALRRGAEEYWRRGWAAGTLALGVLWASADETFQLFQGKRTGSVFDVGYDALGVLLALLAVYGWSLLIFRRAGQADSSLRSE